jgi:hypothetical protein
LLKCSRVSTTKAMVEQAILACRESMRQERSAGMCYDGNCHVNNVSLSMLSV